MSAKIPDFQPLPPQQGETPPRQVAPLPPEQAEYAKNVQQPSFINPENDPVKDEKLSYDPKLRRQWSVEPTLVHATRQPEPTGFVISDELKRRHEESVKFYPDLNLSNAEYVVAEIYRHPIGLYLPVGISAALIIVLLSVLFTYPLLLASNSTYGLSLPDFKILLIFIIPVIAVIIIFAYIAVWVYRRNRFFLTNESVIQEIQYSLFSRHEQTASLGSIEDVSYFQNGIIPTMFNFGHIRMSTEGDESTYRFYYVDNPRKQAAILTNAVEDFKNGRPVTVEDDNDKS